MEKHEQSRSTLFNSAQRVDEQMEFVIFHLYSCVIRYVKTESFRESSIYPRYRRNFRERDLTIRVRHSYQGIPRV